MSPDGSSMFGGGRSINYPGSMRLYRGRESPRRAPPPSEPDRRISRIRLSSWWSRGTDEYVRSATG